MSEVFDFKQFIEAGKGKMTKEELEKEIAELKEKLKPENCLKSLAKAGYIKFTSDNLAKAKEIIREYMRFEPMIGTCSFYSEEYEKTKTKAEQFLSEVEK